MKISGLVLTAGTFALAVLAGCSGQGGVDQGSGAADDMLSRSSGYSQSGEQSSSPSQNSVTDPPPSHGESIPACHEDGAPQLSTVVNEYFRPMCAGFECIGMAGGMVEVVQTMLEKMPSRCVNLWSKAYAPSGHTTKKKGDKDSDVQACVYVDRFARLLRENPGCNVRVPGDTEHCLARYRWCAQQFQMSACSTGSATLPSMCFDQPSADDQRDQQEQHRGSD